MAPLTQDAWATLMVCGLLLGVGRLGVWGRILGPPFAAVRPLLALWPLALVARLLAPVGGPSAAWQTPLEQMHDFGPMGWLATLGGVCGLALSVVPRLVRQRSETQGVVRSNATKLWLGAMPWLLWPYTWLPPWAIDETTYHLALPRQALANGAWVAPLGQGNGGFYALSDWFGAWGMSLGSLSAARSTQLIVAMFGAQAALSIVPFACQTRIAFALMLLWSSPVFLWQAPTAYADCIVTMFSCIAALAAARATMAGEDLKQSKALCNIAALCTGIAVATKVNAVVLIACLTWTLRRSPNAMARAQTYRSLCLSLAPPSVFAIYNVVVYHTPLWPFSAPWWPTPRALLPEQLDVLSAFFAQHGPPPSAWDALVVTRWLHLLWALVFEAAFGSPSFDGVLGGLLIAGLMGTPLIAWHMFVLRHDHKDAHARERIGGIILAWGWVLFAAWQFGSLQARFLLPAVGLWAFGLSLAMPLPRARTTRAVCCVGMLMLQLAFWPSLQGHWPPSPAAVYASTQERIALRQRWSPGTSLCEQLGKEPMQGLALIWTERYLLYCPQVRMADSYDQAAHLQTWLAFDDQGTTALKQLRALHIDTLLVNERLWFANSTLGSKEEQDRWQTIARNWQAMTQHSLRCMMRQGDLSVWSLR